MKDTAGFKTHRRLLPLLAVATGVTVANLYYVQPLTNEVARYFHTGYVGADLAVSLTQAGYGLGLFFLVPLGDALSRRLLAAVLTASCVFWLVVVGATSSLALFYAGLAFVGLSSVLVQILVPYAADLATPADRGRAVSFVMSGLLTGIVTSRTVAGLLGQAVGFHGVYFIAAGVLLVLFLTLLVMLPRERRTSRPSYKSLVATSVKFFLKHSRLRIRCLLGGLSFGWFSVIWASVPFELKKALHLNLEQIGLVSIAGIPGVLSANLAGRVADRGHPHWFSAVAAGASLLGFLPLLLFPSSLAAIVAALVVVDAGCQGVHLSNQAIIYSSFPGARSRVNSVYMTTYFLGGTLASYLTGHLFSSGGLPLCAGFGMALCAAALGLSLYDAWRRGLRKVEEHPAPERAAAAVVRA